MTDETPDMAPDSIEDVDEAQADETPESESAGETHVADQADVPVTEEMLAELKRENEALSVKLADAIRERDEFKEEADQNRPTRDTRHFQMTTPEDVFARFGKEKIYDLAQLERVKQNRERSKNGHFPLPELEGEQLERAVNATVADLLGDKERTRPPVEGPLNRVLKMVDKKGNLRQIPYEPQINNMAGSLADGYERYRQKGFKMPDPMWCATQDCSEFALVNEAGEFAFKGYCSQDHMNRTEREKDQPVPGVTNRNVLAGV